MLKILNQEKRSKYAEDILRDMQAKEILTVFTTRFKFEYV